MKCKPNGDLVMVKKLANEARYMQMTRNCRILPDMRADQFQFNWTFAFITRFSWM